MELVLLPHFPDEEAEAWKDVTTCQWTQDDTNSSSWQDWGYNRSVIPEPTVSGLHSFTSEILV